ncbi:hypothetical protein [Priestia megaterium]|uniref:hypothetical protein n=1 Tax=Priestia megaterium TaxID=1404 RepID=UPI0022B88258|nr:hypothetical protein [Priestia megaterium]MCZ8494334.1 hypothetical protein [Priestia megaterium]
MESKISWFMKNPAVYLGVILLLIFGGQCFLGYTEEHRVYVLEFILSIVGFLMILMSLTRKLIHKKQKGT